MKNYIFALCTVFMCGSSLIGCSDDEKNDLKPTFTVTFNSQGGSEVVSQRVSEGEKAVKPTDPTKKDLAFNGWYTSTEYVKKWNFETDVVTANITLYARWTAETWTVTFNTNGGNEINPILVAKGGLMGDLPIPIKKGFIFEGWYTDETLSNKFDESIPVTQNFTLYAKWIKEGDITRQMLEEKIKEAKENYPSSNYTEESFKYLENKIQMAESVLYNLEATDKEIADAYAALNDAIAKLIPVAIRETVRVRLDPSPIEGVFYLNPSIEFFSLFAWGEDISGYESTNKEVIFEYDEEQLKTWSKDGMINEESGRIDFEVNPDLEKGTEITITVKSAEDTSISETLTLKVSTPEDIKRLFLDAMNALPDPNSITLDNYHKVNAAWEKCENAKNMLSNEQKQNDEEIKNAMDKLSAFTDEFDYWYLIGYSQIEGNKYWFDSEEAIYTPDGNFPHGNFVVRYPVQANIYAEQKVILENGNKLKFEYREGENVESLPWENDGQGEYKLHEGDSKQGILIIHEGKERAAKQFFYKQKMKKNRR